jgi:hypothetical protein
MMKVLMKFFLYLFKVHLLQILLSSSAMAQGLKNDSQLLERQKQLYANSQTTNSNSTSWDSFFGSALYLRATGGSEVVDHSFALELMALARHCQWEVIIDLTQGAQEIPSSPLSNKALALIKLKKGFQTFMSDPRNSKTSWIERAAKTRDQWPLTQRELRLLSSPENLRLHVESLCK